ncbi:iron-containing alcohol dehydrogenase [Roseobacter sp. YSTF-M11]|uniref:Iron-containing alcohol dehydrogenase n=1 Tax=Roseobacter insulae TaxID=2859783 RepID=A0A9X1FZD8_9RHOB|nr:iron-containing alcohol dehydrogenase [Roseobacter insulae]MBW4710104.1 iron-containing alcohol dehydrogenase [Roseobacter insulae]
MNQAAFRFLTAGRIEFGRGKAQLACGEICARGRHVLLVRGRSVRWVDQLVRDLEDQGARVTPTLCEGEPTVEQLTRVLKVARDAAVNVVASVGGGSAIDLGKAAAALLPGTGDVMDHLEGVGGGQPLTAQRLPFIAVPTTSGTGAEVTKNAVIAVADAGRKVSLRDDRMLPDCAIVDPALTDGAPRAQSLASGLDALTQVIEPYLCTRANPLTDALCRQAIPLGARALVRLAAGEDRQARDDMAFVSLSGGLALANAGLGAVHGLAGVLGGRLGAPHGLICGRLLGPVLAANAQQLLKENADMTRFEEVAEWLSSAFDLPSRDTFDQLPDLLDQWEVARLGSWVTADTDLEAIATEAAGASSMKANPCTLSTQALVSTMQLAL